MKTNVPTQRCYGLSPLQVNQQATWAQLSKKKESHPFLYQGHPGRGPRTSLCGQSQCPPGKDVCATVKLSPVRALKLNTLGDPKRQIYIRSQKSVPLYFFETNVTERDSKGNVKSSHVQNPLTHYRNQSRDELSTPLTFPAGGEHRCVFCCR